MAKNRITIKISGDPRDKGDVRLNEFLKRLDSVRNALKQTERLVRSTGEKFSVYYRIVGASKNSPLTMVLECVTETNAPPSMPQEVVGKFLGSISQIKRKGKIPADFDYDAAESYRQIGQGHPASFVIANGRKSVAIDEKYERKIVEAIGPDELVEGSLTGTLDTVRLHNTKAFEIFPTIGPKKVVCHFPENLKENVKQALERYVRVDGRLRYKHWDKFPHAIDVRQMEVYPPAERLPKLSDFFGIAPQLTGKLSEEEFLEKVRDGWKS